MPGIRLRHKDLTNCLYTVEHPLRPLHFPHDCFHCGTRHVTKTYHLHLGSDGTVIVSRTVLQRLREIPFIIGNELLVENEVKNPPPITIGINGRLERHNVVSFDKERKR